MRRFLSDGVKGQITHLEYFCRLPQFGQNHLHFSFLQLTTWASPAELYFISDLGFSSAEVQGSAQRNQFCSASLPLEHLHI